MQVTLSIEIRPNDDARTMLDSVGNERAGYHFDSVTRNVVIENPAIGLNALRHDFSYLLHDGLMTSAQNVIDAIENGKDEGSENA